MRSANYSDPNRYTIKLPRIARAPSEAMVGEEFASPFPLGCRLVGPLSAPKDRKAAETIAWFFKREFKYDFVLYMADEHADEKDRVVLLNHGAFEETGPFAYGAICMRWRTYADHEPLWAMTWIWLHPFERNRGHLWEIWKDLETRFPGFRVEGPVSDAMHAFLTKHSETHRII